MRAVGLLLAAVAGVGAASSSAAAAPKIAAPAAILGLSAPQISLTTAARMPDGSVLVGGRVGKHPLVARVRPSGVLDETFAIGGRWAPRARPGVVTKLLVNDRGSRIDALVQHSAGGQTVTSDANLTRDGHLASFQPYRSLRDSTWAAGDVCAGRPISDSIGLSNGRVLVSFFNDVLAPTNGACRTGVGILTDTTVASSAQGSDAPTGGPWTLGASLGGGQVCAGLVVLGSQVAVGPVDAPADGSITMPQLRPVPASAGRASQWIPTSVFATGPSSCGAVLLGAGHRRALLLESRTGVAAVSLPTSTNEPVAARCNDHVLVFNTAHVGTATSVVVQAVPLGNASRESVGDSITGCA